MSRILVGRKILLVLIGPNLKLFLKTPPGVYLKFLEKAPLGYTLSIIVIGPRLKLLLKRATCLFEKHPRGTRFCMRFSCVYSS